jgi:hypothetical protein
MKTLMLNFLILSICMIFSVGCSTVKPAEPPPATAAAPTVHKPTPVAHNSIFNTFVREYFEGNAPPPDFKEEDKTGIAACLGAAYWASIAGLLLAGGGR